MYYRIQVKLTNLALLSVLVSKSYCSGANEEDNNDEYSHLEGASRFGENPLGNGQQFYSSQLPLSMMDLRSNIKFNLSKDDDFLVKNPDISISMGGNSAQDINMETSNNNGYIQNPQAGGGVSLHQQTFAGTSNLPVASKTNSFVFTSNSQPLQDSTQLTQSKLYNTLVEGRTSRQSNQNVSLEKTNDTPCKIVVLQVPFANGGYPIPQPVAPLYPIFPALPVYPNWRVSHPPPPQYNFGAIKSEMAPNQYISSPQVSNLTPHPIPLQYTLGAVNPEMASNSYISSPQISNLSPHPASSQYNLAAVKPEMVPNQYVLSTQVSNLSPHPASPQYNFGAVKPEIVPNQYVSSPQVSNLSPHPASLQDNLAAVKPDMVPNQYTTSPQVSNLYPPLVNYEPEGTHSANNLAQPPIHPYESTITTPPALPFAMSQLRKSNPSNEPADYWRPAYYEKSSDNPSLINERFIDQPEPIIQEIGSPACDSTEIESTPAFSAKPSILPSPASYSYPESSMSSAYDNKPTEDLPSMKAEINTGDESYAPIPELPVSGNQESKVVPPAETDVSLEVDQYTPEDPNKSLESLTSVEPGEPSIVTQSSPQPSILYSEVKESQFEQPKELVGATSTSQSILDDSLSIAELDAVLESMLSTVVPVESAQDSKVNDPQEETSPYRTQVLTDLPSFGVEPSTQVLESTVSTIAPLENAPDSKTNEPQEETSPYSMQVLTDLPSFGVQPTKLPTSTSNLYEPYYDEDVILSKASPDLQSRVIDSSATYYAEPIVSTIEPVQYKPDQYTEVSALVGQSSADLTTKPAMSIQYFTPQGLKDENIIDLPFLNVQPEKDKGIEDPYYIKYLDLSEAKPSSHERVIPTVESDNQTGIVRLVAPIITHSIESKPASANLEAREESESDDLGSSKLIPVSADLVTPMNTVKNQPEQLFKSASPSNDISVKLSPTPTTFISNYFTVVAQPSVQPTVSNHQVNHFVSHETTAPHTIVVQPSVQPIASNNEGQQFISHATAAPYTGCTPLREKLDNMDETTRLDTLFEIPTTTNHLLLDPHFRIENGDYNFRVPPNRNVNTPPMLSDLSIIAKIANVPCCLEKFLNYQLMRYKICIDCTNERQHKNNGLCSMCHTPELNLQQIISIIFSCVKGEPITIPEQLDWLKPEISNPLPNFSLCNLKRAPDCLVHVLRQQMQLYSFCKHCVANKLLNKIHPSCMTCFKISTHIQLPINRFVSCVNNPFLIRPKVAAKELKLLDITQFPNTKDESLKISRINVENVDMPTSVTSNSITIKQKRLSDLLGYFGKSRNYQTVQYPFDNALSARQTRASPTQKVPRNKIRSWRSYCLNRVLESLEAETELMYCTLCTFDPLQHPICLSCSNVDVRVPLYRYQACMRNIKI